MSFKDKLEKIVVKNNSLLCVGLDSDIDKIPSGLKEEKHPQFAFNKAIIDQTYDLVCAYKPNIAFYEAEGLEGFLQLKFTLKYLKEKYPEIPVILDAKRGDIGNTNAGYDKFIFDFLGADAVTVHPYLGHEALKPFLERKDKEIFVLCRTSNPGAGELQDLEVGGKPLYQILAEKIAKDWNYNGNCGLVVGATYPTELEIVRRIVGNLPILIPGVGAQGGEVKKTVKAGVDSQGKNAIINSSRSIIFASNAGMEAQKLKEEINKFRRKR